MSSTDTHPFPEDALVVGVDPARVVGLGIEALDLGHAAASAAVSA
jgi:hypothetical protein